MGIFAVLGGLSESAWLRPMMTLLRLPEEIHGSGCGRPDAACSIR
jgi:hypothetical protein